MTAPIPAPRFEPVSGAPVCELGESPFWHPGEAALWWCDIAGRRLHRWHPGRGQADCWVLESEPACIAPCLGGGLVVGMRDGLWAFDPDADGGRGRRNRLAAPPYDAAAQRFNDGKADAQGRFWVGTLDDARRPLAALWRWAGGRLERVAEGATVGNGLAWSPDGRTMTWADTTSHRIFAFDVDPADGTLSARRVLAAFTPRAPGAPLTDYGGRPDGAAVDADGALWVAMYEGARLVRLAPDGRLLQSVALPVRCPTMPCFGGADLRTLYVTTARHGRPAAELEAEPWAGCVLAARVDVPGLPVNFARP
ncbi:MAG: SMP-30/gluconolactonase/LRE family protein [Rubrivivax sp.]|jgi:sugar lactone lactonase YvrE|nr:SMP-30/gluconolactonase/LRE family protein [Rubrivivax sp.]